MSVAEDPKICWLDILRADIYKKASETRHCPRSARHGCKDPLPRRAVARRRQRLRDQEGLRGRPVQPLPPGKLRIDLSGPRSEEHTSELQSLMRTSYAVFCVKKKNKYNNILHLI